jgi:hypothetical protein
MYDLIQQEANDRVTSRAQPQLTHRSLDAGEEVRVLECQNNGSDVRGKGVMLDRHIKMSN